MNFGIVRKFFGRIMLITALLMILPMICCFIYHEELKNYYAFLIPVGLLLILGLIFTVIPLKDNSLGVKEGLFIAGSAWLLISLFGALPFVISGVIPNYVDAFFEICSGFSTTGSTILGDIEALLVGNKSIFMWRSFSHWIGGMGLFVLILAVIPTKSGNTLHILRAESPGPQVGKLVSKMQASSRILYLIYLGLTVLEFVLLIFGPDYDWYEALIHAFGTAGTGGFSTHNASFGDVSSYTQIVATVFMFIFAINFTLFYYILIGNIRGVLKSEELRFYLITVFVSTGVIILNLYLNMRDQFSSMGELVRISFFQVGAIISTTGFGIADYDTWPALSKFIIVILMIIGGCAGSTAGGMKVSRIVIALKAFFRKISAALNPNRVKVNKLEGKPIAKEVENDVLNYVLVYVCVYLVCTFLICLDGRCDLATNLSASLTCLNNVGPGFNLVGPTTNFGPSGANYSNFSKIVLALEMIAGRLELYPVLVLFNPRTYLKNY